MNRQLTALLAGLISISAPTYAEGTVEYGNRPFYGFFLSNQLWTNANSGYGFSRQTFEKPYENELLHALEGNIGLYATTAVDGIYYAAPYLFESSMSMPTPRPMFTYNIYTGNVEEIGAWSDMSTDLKPSDMTYDRKNDRILALCFGSLEGGGIYEVNRETGAMTCIRKFTGGGVIAADNFGRVFSILQDGTLVQVDMTKDETYTGIYRLPFAYLQSNQTMEFDVTSGKLYWAANTRINPMGFSDEEGDNGRSSWLVEITLPSIAPNENYNASMSGYSYEVIDEIGSMARFQGLYIPSCTGGFEAPGFASDCTFTSTEDGERCILGFNIPATTFGGEPLDAVDGYDVFRDGTRITTVKGPFTAGSSQQYEDTEVPVQGHEYRYDIICYSNLKGDGPKSPIFAYVGYDAPSSVSNTSISVDDDMKGAVISWTAPENGKHGGTFDPGETRYDIVRNPDNVKVAENISECTIHDSFRRLLRYSYSITAKNSYGQTTTETPEFVAGPAVREFPIDETFENPTSFKMRWNSVDNNGDGLSWLYGTTLGQSVFGDYEMAAEYILSPTSVDSYVKDADEWIISPPVEFEEGRNYHVEFEIRSLTNERLNIYVGPKNIVEGMNRIYTFTLREPQYDDVTDRMVFQKYSFDLPASIAGTTSCVALQLATPIPDNYYSYLQIGNFLIDEGSALGIDGTEADNMNAFTIEGDLLTIAGEFCQAAIYAVNGVKMKEIKSASTSLHGMNGIYILVIDGISHKIAIR